MIEQIKNAAASTQVVQYTCRSSPRRVRYPPPVPSPPPPMVPPRPDALGVWISTPAMRKTERMASVMMSACWTLAIGPGDSTYDQTEPNRDWIASQLRVLNQAVM